MLTFNYDSDTNATISSTATYTRLYDTLLDEFTDVRPAEKGFMKAWNLFMRGDVVVPDGGIGDRLVKFVEGNHVGRAEWAKHLCGLWDNGAVKAEDLERAMDKWDETWGK